jgi:hypothetical protein
MINWPWRGEAPVPARSLSWRTYLKIAICAIVPPLAVVIFLFLLVCEFQKLTGLDELRSLVREKIQREREARFPPEAEVAERMLEDLRQAGERELGALVRKVVAEESAGTGKK